MLSKQCCHLKNWKNMIKYKVGIQCVVLLWISPERVVLSRRENRLLRLRKAVNSAGFPVFPEKNGPAVHSVWRRGCVSPLSFLSVYGNDVIL